MDRRLTGAGNDLRRALEGVEGEAERLERAAGVIARHAPTAGVPELVVTGGTAVAIATGRDFGTRDIDVITAFGDRLGKLLEVMGFRQDQPPRHLWLHEELALVVQSPAASVPAHSDIDEVRVSTGDTVRIWSVTDLVVDRVAQATQHGAPERLGQALALLASAGMRFDTERARRRAADDGVTKGLEALLELADAPPETVGADDPLERLQSRFVELLQR